jgi:hypothetical protein
MLLGLICRTLDAPVKPRLTKNARTASSRIILIFFKGGILIFISRVMGPARRRWRGSRNALGA